MSAFDPLRTLGLTPYLTRMPEWTMYAVAVASLIGGITVGFTASKRSAKAGDGWLKEQVQAGFWGGLTMIGVMAAFIALANIVHWLRG